MPSRALTKFETKMITDVDRLIASHATLNNPGLGRRSLGHITRGGVLMLCAAWERYVEELAIEAAAYLCARAASPQDLPENAQRTISKYIKDHKHDLKPLDMAGDGWRHVYSAIVSERMGHLNTPKAGNIETEYKALLGWSDVVANWSCGKAFINSFVSARGDIAHRGSEASYIRIDKLRDEYLAGIKQTVIEHDNAACDFIHGHSAGGRPWRRR